MQVVHPLVEAGIDKAGVREIARAHGLLDLTDLPAQPCLSRRIETGIALDAEDLAFVLRVETEIREVAGTSTAVRRRITQQGVVLELRQIEDTKIVEIAIAPARATILGACRLWAGYRQYRRGSAFLHEAAPSFERTNSQ